MNIFVKYYIYFIFSTSIVLLNSKSQILQKLFYFDLKKIYFFYFCFNKTSKSKHLETIDRFWLVQYHQQTKKNWKQNKTMFWITVYWRWRRRRRRININVRERNNRVWRVQQTSLYWYMNVIKRQQCSEVVLIHKQKHNKIYNMILTATTTTIKLKWPGGLIVNLYYC